MSCLSSFSHTRCQLSFQASNLVKFSTLRGVFGIVGIFYGRFPATWAGETPARGVPGGNISGNDPNRRERRCVQRSTAEFLDIFHRSQSAIDLCTGIRYSYL